ATLDRNGLRPARYYITKDGRVIMASEVGVIKVNRKNILEKGRLYPGRMLLIDTALKKIIPDEELKNQMAKAAPYGEWLRKERIKLENLPQARVTGRQKKVNNNILKEQLTFGYTDEEKRLILAPMSLKGVEPIGSMGTDTPISVLSDKSESLFSYFKQLFAQVTNPPLDAIREELVTSLGGLLGPEGNFLEPVSKSCRQIEIPVPVLTNGQFERIRQYRKNGFKTKTLRILFSAKKAEKGLGKALELLFQQADQAINAGYTTLLLSDKSSNKKLAPIPSLLAVSALHNYLVRQGTRTKVSIIISTGDAREVHHFCCLIGYGASAINPYLAFATIAEMVDDKTLSIDKETALQNYIKAGNKGILKIMSKMGISTLDGY
ncbi:MAG: glutamate synthase central domain-containing protein, partial [Candidatus Paceibacterales bacterium]